MIITPTFGEQPKVKNSHGLTVLISSDIRHTGGPSLSSRAVRDDSKNNYVQARKEQSIHCCFKIMIKVTKERVPVVPQKV